MRCYKQITDGKLIAIGTGPGGIEITPEEYAELDAMIQEKAALVNKLYAGEITIEDVPVGWQEEIQERVNKRIEAERQAEQQEISSEEFYNMVEGVL